MDNNVTITNTKESVLDFQVTVNGVEVEDMKVRFVVETTLGEMGFVATKKDNEKWAVTIPALPHVERTAHNFRIDVVVDGYYFEAMRGVLNVTGPVDLYATVPKPEAKPSVNPSVKPEIPKKAETPTVPVTPPNAANKPITKSWSPIKPVQESEETKKPVEKLAEKISKKVAEKADKKSKVKKAIDESKTKKKIVEKKETTIDTPLVTSADEIAKTLLENNKKKVAKKKVTKKLPIKKLHEKKVTEEEKVVETKPIETKKKIGKKDAVVTAVLENIGNVDQDVKPEKKGFPFKKGKVVKST